MYFSEAFKVDRVVLMNYGAVDISLICDTPLFIDPMLIFNSKKTEYQQLHNDIIKYLHFLARKFTDGNLSIGDIKNLYAFKEIKENWLGYSLVGNCGSALGIEFAEFFARQISFVLDTHNITKSPHIEKAMLLYDKTGKDRLSDFTANLINGYLVQYTEAFAVKNISKELCDRFPVERSCFNYETESFEVEEYTLPFIFKDGKKEYILLTPADILREDDSSINKKDLLKSNIRIRNSIDNDVLKAQVENYIGIAIKNFEEERKQIGKRASEKQYAQIEKEAFYRALQLWPELYDYYVKIKEEDSETIINIAQEEREKIQSEYIERVSSFVNAFKSHKSFVRENLSAIDEARERIKFFKNKIEFGGLYKDLYYNNEPIASEGTLQRMFKLVWCRTNFDANSEVNNGTGPVDYKISLGKDNSQLVEFKLAKNSRLNHILQQTASYEEANETKHSLIVIFYFSEIELVKVNTFLNQFNLHGKVGTDVFLVDCRNDNKVSASKL